VPTAYAHIRETPHYRRDSFISGLSRLGYVVAPHTPDRPLAPNDVLVIWNKTARSTQAIQMARQGGAAVIVAENGYYGRDENSVQRYALALDGHNGSGRWFAFDRSRLDALAIDFKPLRVPRNNRVLVAAQRGIGSPIMRSPHDWHETMARRLLAAGYEPRIRAHPGTGAPPVSLEDDLADCSALAVWSSNCATAALIAGVPTFYDAPAIITAGSARPMRELLAQDFREFGLTQAFSDMAWAQWTITEIASGKPFEILLHIHTESLPSCRPGIDLA
jgi:hypothetical protein